MGLEQTFEALKGIGFGEYEARAYGALLARSPANGYQIAAQSGIPRAKIYETLNRLVVRGAAVRVETSDRNARVFVAVDPETLVENMQKGMNAACERARIELRKIKHEPDMVEFFRRITDREDLVTHAHSLIHDSRNTLHAALWAEEFDSVHKDFLRAAKRGVRMAVMLYSGHPDLKMLQEFGVGAVLHSQNKKQVVPKLGRQFMLASDHRQCITGSIFNDGSMDGVFSMNRGLISNTVDLVNHEIYVERIMTEVGEPVFRLYRQDMSGLNSFDRPANRPSG